LVEQLARGFLAITAIEWLAVVLALAYLLLAVRQSAWCWLFAALSSAIYAWIFVRAALPMQAALQVFYIAMAAYGWYSWRRGPEPGRAASSRATLEISRWPLAAHVVAIGAVVLVTALNVALLRLGSRAAVTTASPWVEFADAALAWGSVLTTFMVARKILENWLYWIVLDLAAAWLYAAQSLYATAALFVIYTVVAARGYVEWSRSAPRRGVPDLADA
jgi:nicotinamide mononucleotide transporter